MMQSMHLLQMVMLPTERLTIVSLAALLRPYGLTEETYLVSEESVAGP